MSLVSPHVLVWFRQLGGDLGDVLSPPFSWSLSPWGSFSQGIGCGTHRFQSSFVGHHFATFIRVCVLRGEDQSTQEGQIKTQGGPPSQEQGCFMSRLRVGRGFGGCADGEPLRLPLSSFPPRVGESGGGPPAPLPCAPNMRLCCFFQSRSAAASSSCSSSSQSSLDS